ncbi:MAG: hypothetical protein BECKG1743D_GA0114223_105962, partial [Candidatus Kentron sp. G]
LLSQAQDSSLTHSTLQLRATMSAIRHPCLIMGQCPSNFEGRNTLTITYSADGKTYDSTTGVTVTNSEGWISGDDISVSESASFDNDHAGLQGVTITGITLAGDDAENYDYNTTASTSATINQAALTVGYSATDKTYDSTTGVTVTSSDDRISGDDITITETASFDNEHAGAQGVTITGITLGGSDAGNYTYNTTASTSATINQASLTVGYSATDKTYDSTTGVTVTSSDDRISGDDITITETASFTDEHVGTHTVNVTGITLGGSDAGNYTYNTTASTSATISVKAITATAIAAADKVYDSTTTASVSGGEITGGSTADDDNLFITGDDVALDVSGATGIFDSEHVGAHGVTVSGLALTGTDAGNYTITDASGASATITAKAVDISGSRVYDSTVNVAASIFTAATGITGEALNLTGSGTVASKNVSAGSQTVTLGNLALADGAGGLASNYTLTGGTHTATITAKTITASGVTASDKVYDGTVTATLITTNATLTGGAAADNDNKYYTGDAVTLMTSGASGSFGDAQVGAGKTVTVSNLALSGDDAGNYLLALYKTLADITEQRIESSLIDERTESPLTEVMGYISVTQTSSVSVEVLASETLVEIDSSINVANFSDIQFASVSTGSESAATGSQHITGFESSGGGSGSSGGNSESSGDNSKPARGRRNRP